jgi:hypothetical protein
LGQGENARFGVRAFRRRFIHMVQLLAEDSIQLSLRAHASPLIA